MSATAHIVTQPINKIDSMNLTPKQKAIGIEDGVTKNGQLVERKSTIIPTLVPQD